MSPSDVSIVIPTLNEESVIGGCIEAALQAGAREIIVSDGGSQDLTVQRAKESGATQVVRSIPGRGTQLNSGALLARRDYVLFLHADNRLGADCLQQICETEPVVWGAFRQRIDSDRMVFRWLEWGNAIRVRWRGMPFGDQGIFARRADYKQQGGFDEIPLMEDVAFSRRMRRVAKPVLLDGPLEISARRWQKNGVVRQTLCNWKIQLAYMLGVSPRRLQSWYR